MIQPRKHEVYSVIDDGVVECNRTSRDRYYVKRDLAGLEQVYFAPSAENKAYGVQGRLIRPRILADGRRDFSDFFEEFPSLEKIVRYVNGGEEHLEGDFKYTREIIRADEPIILKLFPEDDNPRKAAEN